MGKRLFLQYFGKEGRLFFYCAKNMLKYKQKMLSEQNPVNYLAKPEYILRVLGYVGIQQSYSGSPLRRSFHCVGDVKFCHKVNL